MGINIVLVINSYKFIVPVFIVLVINSYNFLVPVISIHINVNDNFEVVFILNSSPERNLGGGSTGGTKPFSTSLGNVLIKSQDPSFKKQVWSLLQSHKHTRIL